MKLCVKSGTPAVVLSLLVVGYLAFRVTIYLFDGMDYQVLSTQKSPDGSRLLTHMKSMSESSHAPYGDHLVLSRWGVNTPDKGYVVFAGYCENLDYSWGSSEAISITCSGENKEELIKTLVKKAYGIRVVFNENL